MRDGNDTTDDASDTVIISLLDLADRSRWVAWQDEQRGDGKKTKVPYCPNDRRKAKADDQSTWGTRVEAEKRARRLERPFGSGGVGIELGILGDGISIGGIDLDACCEPGGMLEDWAKEVVQECDSYTEVSPSRTGAKAFFTYCSSDLTTLRNMGLIEPGGGSRKPGYGRQFKRGAGEHPPAIELHLGNRYFAVTDQKLPGAPTELRHMSLEKLIWLLQQHGPAFVGKAKPGQRANGQDTSRSAIAFRKGAEMRRSGRTFDEMCAALRVDPETADWCREKGDADNARELRRIWDNAAASTQGAPAGAMLADFNTSYMVVNENGKTRIYAPRYDVQLRRRYYERTTYGEFKSLYCNRLVQVRVGSETKWKTIANVWLESEDRREFIHGVIFDPSGRTEAGVLNLWEGFGVEPSPKGSWSKMFDHIDKIICKSNKTHIDYLMGWMATLAQRPDVKPEVAVVMQSNEEGVGKGILGRALKRLLGQHGIHISNSEHITGRFNLHLRDTVFVFLDEAFWAGDKKHIGILKALITEPTISIEGKGMNVYEAPSFTHLMIATNDDWAVPAAIEARRFFVLKPSDARKGDRAYFNAIIDQLEDGGYEAMLHDLLHYDLSNFDVRSPPDSAGLQEQKKLSLKTHQEWWMDVLHRGYVWQSKLGLELYFGVWHEAEPTELLYASYLEFAKSRHERRPLHREKFGVELRKLGGVPVRGRDVVVGEHMTDGQGGEGSRRIAETITKLRAPGYKFGTLSQARIIFTEAAGFTVDWQDDGLDWSESKSEVS